MTEQWLEQLLPFISFGLVAFGLGIFGLVRWIDRRTEHVNVILRAMHGDEKQDNRPDAA